ncbi:MAG: cbb3-type cytochrome c oxidase subunit 3 [Parvularculaceae bacterium]|nr:cbb3-type cytochrome c oxidase subunit 3 [Parvularculaceae bacterium]
MHVLLSDIAQTFGLVLFVVAFALVLVYALAPSNRSTFDRAALTPLDTEDQNHDQL